MSGPRHARLTAGTEIGGRYQIQALVGAGASGAVYRSRDLSDDSICALKIVLADAFDGQTLHEYRILARVSHPGCVKVHDVGVDPTHGPYLVMDFVTGLDPRLAVDAASHADVHGFASRVLHTLDHLHGHGVLHGDLKPQNVRCVEGDATRPVLLDFGLATGPASDNMTGGTVRYMAPELFAGRPRDIRSDLYAVGIMLYELLAGTAPFVAPNITGLVQAHMFTPPPPLAERAPTAHPAFVLWGP